jgi:ABC-2 type transport system permease protein
MTTYSSALVTYRELGVLRRMSTTPVPPSWLLAAQGVVQLGVALAGLTGILVAGAALGTPAPANPAGFAVAVVLSVAGLFRPGWAVLFGFLAMRFFRWE